VFFEIALNQILKDGAHYVTVLVIIENTNDTAVLRILRGQVSLNRKRRGLGVIG